MALHPTLYELERAILSYTSPTLKGGLKEWQAMKWLWEQLSWSARLVTHLGASSSSWWKERYVLPLLCTESISFLQQYVQGDWTRAEEESLRHCFHFFVPYAAKSPDLFPQAITQFLSGICPSFNTERELALSRFLGKGGPKNCSWLRDETFAQYRSRMQALVKRPSSQRVQEKEEPLTPAPREDANSVNDETREKTKKRIEEISSIRDEAAQLVLRMDQSFAKAFPLRQEAEQDVGELKNVKEEMLAFLLEIDGVLFRFSELAAVCISDTEARRLTFDMEKGLKELRFRVSDLRTRGEEICGYLEEQKSTITRRLQALTRVLDHVPLLESANHFRVHQSRVVRMGRENLKRFRGLLTKGPGPDMRLCQLEHEIADAACLATAFYDEGTKIASMKEKLHHLEHHIQELLSHASSSSAAASLRKLLSEAIELKRTLEVASDRSCRFEQIVQGVHECEPKKI